MTAILEESTIVLASGSPRRKELLALLGLNFTVTPADVDESINGEEDPANYVARVSKSKALAAKELIDEDSLIISADTTVVHAGKIVGKPATSQDAEKMLKSMRSKSHQVISGLSLYVQQGEKLYEDIATTEVAMRNYTDIEIREYVESGDPLDKAGSYAIQHQGFHPVQSVTGCFANVVGLPLCHLTRTMKKARLKMGYSFGEDVAQKCQAHFNYECPIYGQVLQGEL